MVNLSAVATSVYPLVFLCILRVTDEHLNRPLWCINRDTLAFAGFCP
jgi:hypothetical protein